MKGVRAHEEEEEEGLGAVQTKAAHREGVGRV